MRFVYAPIVLMACFTAIINAMEKVVPKEKPIYELLAVIEAHKVHQSDEIFYQSINEPLPTESSFDEKYNRLVKQYALCERH